MTSVPPGTYRIINVKSGTALTVSDGREGYIFCWQRHDGPVQQWQVHQSGDRYRFKNCGTDLWLSVPNPENANEVCATRYPVTWDLDQTEQDHESYMFRFRDYNRVLDLDGWGAEWNGNKTHMSLDTTWMPHRSWKFERLGHEPRAEDQRLHKQIAERDHKIAEKDQQLAEKNRRLVELEARIEALKREDDGAQQASQRPSPNDVPTIVDHDDHQSTEHTEDISNLQEALRRANDTIRDREITIITLQNQLLLQERVNHETKDVHDLRNRVADVESRLQGEGGPSNRNAT